MRILLRLCDSAADASADVQVCSLSVCELLHVSVYLCGVSIFLRTPFWASGQNPQLTLFEKSPALAEKTSKDTHCFRGMY